MPYEILDKTAPFSLAYGIVNLHTGNSKFVRSKSEIVGNSIQKTAQFALLMGVQHAIRKITYDGTDITDYQFYKGTPGQIASLSPDGNSPSFFPNDVNHWKDASKPSASFINVRYPIGQSLDGQPEKTVIQLDSTETKRYNAAGSVIDFGYSANPARAVTHAIEVITGRIDIIDFGALHEYEAWCDELITINKDGSNIQIPRFRLDAFFTPPFTVKEFLNRVCQLTCSDFQERGGKIRMIPPISRPVDFVFDYSNLSADLNDFEFEPVNAKSKFNGVIASWLDLDDPLKGEGEPIIVDRRANSSIPKKFYQLNLGGAYRDQAERVTNYTAKVQCDLTDYAAIKASYAAYPVLPCDIGTVKHPVPAWGIGANEPVRVKVLRKKEKEDRVSTTGIEKGDGYPIYVRREPELYSDTDFNPVTTRTQLAGINPFAAPPVPVLAFSQTTYIGRNGAVERQLTITVQFGTFAGKQRARLQWAKPGEALKPLIELAPETNVYVITNPPVGDNAFRVRAYNVDYYTQSQPDDFVFYVGSINTALDTPEIDKIGLATLNYVDVGIKNFSKLVKFRRWQLATSVDFTVFDTFVHDFRDTVNLLDAVERIPRPSAGTTPLTRYLRIGESTNGEQYTEWSNVMEVIFFNEMGLFVPELFEPPNNTPKVALLEGEWQFDFVLPKKNNTSPLFNEIRLINVSNGKHTADSYSESANSITFADDISDLPATGRFFNNTTKETIAYTNKSGSTVTGVIRGVDGSTAQSIAEGENLYPIDIQKDLKERVEWSLRQSNRDYYIQNRYENGAGKSPWSEAAFAAGQLNPVQPSEPTPPPAIEPVPDPGYESPLDPDNDRFRNRFFDIQVV